MWKCEGHRIAKTTFQMKKNIGGLKLSDFKTYCKASVFKAVCVCLKDWHVDQENRIVNTLIDPHKYGWWIADKDVKFF